MTRAWKDQRKYPVSGPAKLVWSIRARTDLRDQIKSLAKTNNTTVEAIVDFALERFLDAEDPQRAKTAPVDAGPGLFD